MENKTKKIEENFLTSNVFLFESYGCICETASYSENVSSHTISALNLTVDKSNKIRFAFGSKVGLVRLNIDGSVAESNILGKLVAIHPYDFESYISFFNRNGFLFPISPSMSESIGILELRFIIDRLRATMELISTITDISRTSYDKIARLIFYHLFAPVVHIETKGSRYRYSSDKHQYSVFLEEHKYDPRDPRLNDTFNNETFTFTDNLGSTTINADFVDSVLCGRDVNSKYNTPLFRDVFTIYCSPRDDKPQNMLLINDFIFHYLYEVGIIDHVDLDSSYYIENSVKKENYNSQLKSTAVNIAKYILKEEIEANLKRVHPSYNISTLEPTWKIDSLLSALYFGLFYMRPHMETYRRCANPKCNEFFIVPISSRKKKYCCTACMNRDMAARKRARDRLKISAE